MPTASIGSAQNWKRPDRSSHRWSSDFSWGPRHGRRSGSAQVRRAGWLSGQLRRWRKLDGSGELVRSADLGIETAGGPHPALLGYRIAGDQAEFRAVALRPLEIVEAGPVQVSANWCTILNGPQHRRKMGSQEFRPQRVMPVREAVFRDIDRQSLAP